MSKKQGTLYLVATPIGNLEDITFRALRILNEVDLIAAEDTRHTIKLLNHFNIKKKMISYHQHNEREMAGKIIERLNEGLNLALVSDAGMPGISDPGTHLVAESIKSGINVVPIPGPSAVITALAASGLDTGSFLFVGFLSRKKSELIQRLKGLEMFNGTLIFYESPYRVGSTLKMIRDVLGNRLAVVARELTKVHEDFIRGDLDSLVEQVDLFPRIGEFTLLISGTTDSNRQNSTLEVSENLFTSLKSDGSSLKEELKTIAKKTGKSTKEIYRLYLEYQKDNFK